MTDYVSINFALHPRDTPITALNGPGTRFSVWVQGCSLRCTSECISPQMLDSGPRHIVAVADAWAILWERARSCGQQVDGITLLGGEPTDQAPALALLASLAQSHGWSVVTYTGYKLEALLRLNRDGVDDLLTRTDILVDGPYIPALRDPMLRWRGSSNQRVLLLSNRFSPEELSAAPIRKGTDITLTVDGKLVVSGMQDAKMLAEFVESLRNRGVIE